MKSRATYIAASMGLHVALFAGLLALTPQRERGAGIDYTVVELSFVPGLEQLLEDEVPTGAERAEHVSPEPAPESVDDVPVPVVDTPEPASEPRVAESPAQAPEIAIVDAAAGGTSDPVEASPAAETEPRRDAPPSQEAIATELDATDLAAVVVSVSRRKPPEALEPERNKAPLSASEQEIVEHHVATWAQSFASLAEWQPSTTWIEDDQAYSATVTRMPAPDNMGLEEAVVTVTTRRDGQTFSTEMRMQRLGFSHFAQFIDHWDPQVQIHDDRIEGRFHSNSEIKISRSGGVQPVFHGRVTTARGIDTSQSEWRVRRNEVFLGGLETRVRRITLPRRVALFGEDGALASQRMRHFTADTRIEFHADGSFTSTPLESPGPAQRESLGTAPFYIVADEQAELHVRGIVNGKVLVYSPEDIVIEGNLVYAVDPQSDPSSDDYLGLVSERSVEIADSQITGPGDLSIHAAIYARSRFAVRAFRSRHSGTLFVHGSVTAGTLTATEPRFRTHLTFDTRLAGVRPPSFPVTDQFEIAEWDGHWVVNDESLAATAEHAP